MMFEAIARKENCEPKESSMEKDIAAFKDYINKHKDEIEEGIKKGGNITDILYSDFYNIDKENLKFHDGEEKCEATKEKYDSEMSEIRREIEEYFTNAILDKKYAELRVISEKKDYWMNVNANGGLDTKKDKIGRIYFNVKLEKVPSFFRDLIEKIRTLGIHAQIKAPQTGGAYEFDRTDKIILYFKNEEEKKVLEILDSIGESQSLFLEEKTPKFAGEVSDSKGKVIKGIGFGEEPTKRDKHSFGSLRAEILGEIYMIAKQQGLSISDTNFNFDAYFREICQINNVDPDNFCYNLVENNFKNIRERQDGLYGRKSTIKEKPLSLVKEEIPKTERPTKIIEKKSPIELETEKLRRENQQKFDAVKAENARANKIMSEELARAERIKKEIDELHAKVKREDDEFNKKILKKHKTKYIEEALEKERIEKH